MYVTIDTQDISKEGDVFLMDTLELSIETVKTIGSNGEIMRAVSKMIDSVNEDGITFIKDINSIDITDSEIEFECKIEEYYNSKTGLLEILNYLKLLKEKIENGLDEKFNISFMNMNIKRMEK